MYCIVSWPLSCVCVCVCVCVHNQSTFNSFHFPSTTCKQTNKQQHPHVIQSRAKQRDEGNAMSMNAGDDIQGPTITAQQQEGREGRGRRRVAHTFLTICTTWIKFKANQIVLSFQNFKLKTSIVAYVFVVQYVVLANSLRLMFDRRAPHQSAVQIKKISGLVLQLGGIRRRIARWQTLLTI